MKVWHIFAITPKFMKVTESHRNPTTLAQKR